MVRQFHILAVGAVFLFLGAFVNDYYTSSYNTNTIASTGRGDHVYLAGWADDAPLPITLDGAKWNSQDTTLYLIQLDAQQDNPTAPVTISGDRFTWLTLDKTSVADEAPLNLSLQPGEQVTFRFTPLPGAVLTNVSRLRIVLDHSSLGGSSVPVFLYNWAKGDFEQVDVATNQSDVDNPARFLGPQNAVIVRLSADAIGGYLRVDQLTIEQEGTF